MTNEELKEYEECGLVMTQQRQRIAQLEAALEDKHQQYTGAVIALTEARAVADRYQKADDAAVQLLEKAKLTLEVPAAEYVPAISDAWQLIENALEKIR